MKSEHVKDYSGTGHQKPDVEVYFPPRLPLRGPRPFAFECAALESPGAWQPLANVFQNLEIHSEMGQVRACPFDPAGPKVFATLRVHLKLFPFYFRKHFNGLRSVFSPDQIQQIRAAS